MFNSPTVVFDAVFRNGYPDTVGVLFAVVGDVGVGVDVVRNEIFHLKTHFHRLIDQSK